MLPRELFIFLYLDLLKLLEIHLKLLTSRNLSIYTDEYHWDFLVTITVKVTKMTHPLCLRPKQHDPPPFYSPPLTHTRMLIDQSLKGHRCSLYLLKNIKNGLNQMPCTVILYHDILVVFFIIRTC